MKDYLLFIDTEATGLPKKWNSPYSKENNWPYAVQVSWIIYTKGGQEVKYENHYVKEDDITISQSAFKIHGITTEHLKKEGVSRKEILSTLTNDIKKYQPVVAGHFIELDFHVLSADYYRCSLENPLNDTPLFCTMVATKGFIMDRPEKHLKLSELYKLLFNETLLLHHNALVDARATAECFFELVKRGRIGEAEIEQQHPVRNFATGAKKFGCSLVLVLILAITVILFWYEQQV